MKRAISGSDVANLPSGIAIFGMLLFGASVVCGIICPVES
jgi:hypothetical protein